MNVSLFWGKQTKQTGFVGVIEVKDTEIDHPSLSRWALIPIASVLIRERLVWYKDEKTQRRGRGNVTMEAEVEGRGQGSEIVGSQKLKANRFSSVEQKVTALRITWFWLSDLHNCITFCCFKIPSLCYFCYSNQRNNIPGESAHQPGKKFNTQLLWHVYFPLRPLYSPDKVDTREETKWTSSLNTPLSTPAPLGDESQCKIFFQLKHLHSLNKWA